MPPIATTIVILVILTSILLLFSGDRGAKFGAMAFVVGLAGAQWATHFGNINQMTPFLVFALLVVLKWSGAVGWILGGIYLSRAVLVGVHHSGYLPDSFWWIQTDSSADMFWILNNELFVFSQIVIALYAGWRGGWGIANFMGHFDSAVASINGMAFMARKRARIESNKKNP